MLTRIPINYLSRIINVKFFGFSITFDRVLGAVSVSLAAWCFAAYSRQLKINIKWFITFMIVMFSLNKWEMLTNGSGWSHFFAFAFIITRSFSTDITGDKSENGTKRYLCCFHG